MQIDQHLSLSQHQYWSHSDRQHHLTKSGENSTAFPKQAKKQKDYSRSHNDLPPAFARRSQPEKANAPSPSKRCDITEPESLRSNLLRISPSCSRTTAVVLQCEYRITGQFYPARAHYNPYTLRSSVPLRTNTLITYHHPRNHSSRKRTDLFFFKLDQKK